MKGDAVLFIGGEGPERRLLGRAVEDAGLIVAADSGFDLARSYGVTPDLLVGDLDSIEDAAGATARLGDAHVERHSTEKDETDTEIGLRACFERGFRVVTLIGGGGGRLDHLLGIAAIFERDVRPHRWLTRRDEVVSIDDSAAFRGMRGRLCSFLPVGRDACRMTSVGLRWPLDGLTWRHGDVGLSNFGVDDEVRVTMTSGRLIMIRALEESRDA